MRIISAFGLSALTVLVAGASPAESRLPVVVELFTSQGCSSCPPADAMLADLAKRDGVIALSLHVDYWDYIGWPDSFASPLHTARQEGYARAAGERMIYTPQIIVNGQDRVVGGDTYAVMEKLQAHADATTPVDLRVERREGELRIEAGPAPLSHPVEVMLVRYVPEDKVDIAGGENAGLSMAYHNIVTSWDHLGQWDGQGPLSMTQPIEGPESAVILLQEQGFGPIRAAAKVGH